MNRVVPQKAIFYPKRKKNDGFASKENMKSFSHTGPVSYNTKPQFKKKIVDPKRREKKWKNGGSWVSKSGYQQPPFNPAANILKKWTGCPCHTPSKHSCQQYDQT
jgi:hypothetical protein